MKLDPQSLQIVGSAGSLTIPQDDEISVKLFMLLEGELEGLGAVAAAAKFGFSKQRYFQLRTAFLERGAIALQSDKRGPKKRSRRTDEAVRQIIRQRFLDPDASAAVVAQKLRQSGLLISTRSVERVIAEFGLQKKTL
jgi:transposase